MKFGSSRDLFEEGSLEEVRLHVEDGGESVVCRISREALESLANRPASQPGDLLRIAHDYFELMTDKWAHRIELGVCELDGSVLLRRADITSRRIAPSWTAPVR